MSEDGTTFYSTDQCIIVITSHSETGNFNIVKHNIMKMKISPIQKSPMYSKFCFSMSRKNFAFGFSGDSTKTGNCLVSLHDSESGSVLGTVEIFAKNIVTFCFSPDDEQICVITQFQEDTHNLWIIDTLTMTIKTSHSFPQIKNMSIYTHQVSWSPDKSTILIPTYKTIINEYGDGEGTSLFFVNFALKNAYMAGFDFTVTKLNWNSTSDKICLYTSDNQIGVYDVKSYQCTLKTYDDKLTTYISSVSFLPDDRLIVEGIAADIADERAEMDGQVRRVLNERSIAIENGTREIKPIADVRAQCCSFKDIAHRDGNRLDTRCEEFLFRLACSRSLRRNAFGDEVT
jgi:WD40 repeat protein